MGFLFVCPLRYIGRFRLLNLTQFLQVRNPNVPAISNKLIKPETRAPLTAQHRYWNTVMQITGPIECIYTGRQLHSGEYELDHFIPWSFVSHNLLWNLVPADGSVNSSKTIDCLIWSVTFLRWRICNITLCRLIWKPVEIVAYWRTIYRWDIRLGSLYS